MPILLIKDANCYYQSNFYVINLQSAMNCLCDSNAIINTLMTFNKISQFLESWSEHVISVSFPRNPGAFHNLTNIVSKCWPFIFLSSFFVWKKVLWDLCQVQGTWRTIIHIIIRDANKTCNTCVNISIM